jgi:capsular exopolysaccharide synthesis family protein
VYADAPPPPGPEAPGAPSELQSFVAFLVRRQLLIIGMIFACVIAALALALRQDDVYEASMLLRVNSSAAQASSQNDQLEASANLAKTYSSLITSTGFLTEASAGLAPAVRLTPAELEDRVSAPVVTDTSLISLRATGASPEEARGVTQAMGDYVVRTIASADEANNEAQRQRLAEQIASLDDQIQDALASRSQAVADKDQAAVDRLDDQLDSLRFERREFQTQRAQLFGTGAPDKLVSISAETPATAGSAPIAPRPVFNAALGLFFGLLIGLILAWLRDQLDRRVQSVAELERISGVPTLAVVPIVRGQKAASVLENAFDAARVAVTLASPSREAHELTVTATRDGEGTSLTVAELGRAFARAGRRTVVVDADPETGGLTDALAGSRAPDVGLPEVLLGAATVEDGLVEVDADLWVLGAGTGHPLPTAQLDGRSLDGLLDDLRARFDVIVVDTPATTRTPVASVLAVRTGGLVLVARLGTVQRSELTSAVRAFQAASIPTIGLVAHSADAAPSTYARGRRRRVLGRLRGTPAPAPVAEQAVTEPPHGGG